MSKNLAIATALAALAVSGMFIAGCASDKESEIGAANFTILSDRGCIPPPYASPSPRSYDKPAQDAPQPPATFQGEQTFVPPPANDPAFTPAAPNQESDPVFTPSADAPAQASAPAAAPATEKQAGQSKQAKAVRTYKVKKGDYLSVIAYMYKVSTQDLAAENDMQINEVLREGRVLKLPEYALENPRPRPAVKKKPAQTKASASKSANEKQEKKTEAKSSAPENDVYVVQANDNLWTIVRKNKVKEADVRALNPQIKDFSKLQIGDKIRLRASSASDANAEGKQPAVNKEDANAQADVPVAPVQIGAEQPIAAPDAPADNAAPADAPAPEVKPVQLSPELNFAPMQMNPAPAANPGAATAE